MCLGIRYLQPHRIAVPGAGRHHSTDRHVVLSSEGRVEYVRRLQESSELLRTAGERLGKLQIERRLALEQDDRERAQLKEKHIHEYRQQLYAALDIDALLEKKGVSYPPGLILYVFAHSFLLSRYERDIIKCNVNGYIYFQVRFSLVSLTCSDPAVNFISRKPFKSKNVSVIAIISNKFIS